MFDIALMVGGVMLLCAIIFSPFVLWDLYKKKKRGAVQVEEQGAEPEKKTILWWQAGLCALVIISFFLYFLLRGELDFILPAIIAYPYFALVAWCVYFVSGKRLVFGNKKS
jgi:hypothetical protein